MQASLVGGACAALFLALVPSSWAASCPARAAWEARARYEAVDYPASVRATLEVEQCQDGSAAELAEALRWRAQALAAGGNAQAATEAFALLGTVAPDYALDPLVSPKIHRLSGDGQRKARAEGRVFARLLEPRWEDGRATLRVELFDPRKRATSVLFSFEGGEPGVEITASLREGRTFEAQAPRHAGRLYSAVVETIERVAFRTPSARLPTSRGVSTAAPPKEGWPELKQPQEGGGQTIWIVAGAVAAVAAGAALLAVSNRPPEGGSLGRIEIP